MSQLNPPFLCLQELSEYLGLVKLNARLAEPSLQDYFSGLFPQDTMQNMRFSINFFTSIGLGGITDRQRQLYKEVGNACRGVGGGGGEFW
jgi:pre-mRNA-splicing factor CWC22